MLLATGFNQIVLGQNSTTSDIPEPPYDKGEKGYMEQNSSAPSSPEDNSTSTYSANATGASEAQDSGTNSTAQEPTEFGSDSEQSQNSTSSTTGDVETSNPETNQTSTILEGGPASGNVTNSNTNQNSTENENYQNNTSTGQQGNSTTAQPTNGTYFSNTTETGLENSTSYDSTQTMENATISSNLTLTDSIAVNQTATLSPPPDFDISIDPLTTSIEAGSSTTYSIIVSSINGFNADVSLSITSRSIEGITAILSSNMTKPPPNASVTSFFNIQSDPTTPSGKYKLKVTASSANMSDSSTSVALEVIGKNVTLEQVEQFDPVAMTPVLIKDMQGNIIDDISSNRMVLISTTVNNNYDNAQPFIIVVEVRDKIGTTLYLQLQKGILNPLGEVEVAISWTPDKAGTYQIRTFAIDEIKEHPEPLSVPVGKTVEVK